MAASLVTASAAIALVLVPATTAAAASLENEAIAVTNARYRTDIDVAFQVTHERGPVVNVRNRAIARSSNCTRCRAIAVAIQIDLVGGVVTKVNPQNVSLARNFRCVKCETLADAHQFVVARGGEDVDLTEQGRAELHAIRRELLADVRSGVPIPQLQAEVDGLVPRIDAVLGTQVRSERPDDHRGGRSRPERLDDDDRKP